SYVIGIVHTNYRSYALNVTQRACLHTINALTVRAHCHRIIKLSNTLQRYAGEKEMVCNVHGVRNRFLEIGDDTASKKEGERFTKGAYFIGKV
ncbi:unnamed protein product, partial [Choristocarpus tenellus]